TRRRGNIFGYIGRPSFGSTDLAKVLDISVKYDLNDDADFFYFELALKF
ncbi:MAG: hypothetical protein JRI87_03265, partial [Deltaproteobacteria bacterium]|nr:hypothetical protein [Deltaproteobacteria bacterium]